MNTLLTDSAKNHLKKISRRWPKRGRSARKAIEFAIANSRIVRKTLEFAGCTKAYEYHLKCASEFGTWCVEVSIFQDTVIIEVVSLDIAEQYDASFLKNPVPFHVFLAAD
jgi:hypothetical protein